MKDEERADLAELLVKLGAATGSSRHLNIILGQALGLIDDALIYTYPDGTLGARGNCDPWPNWTGDTDRALDLADRIFPGTKIMLTNWAGGALRWSARIGRDDDNGRGATSPLAICTAIVEAKIRGRG